MRRYLGRFVREWELSCLWAAGVLVAVFAGVQAAAVWSRPEEPRVETAPGKRLPSYLNKDTAFEFLRPLPADLFDNANPFAFTLRLPPPKPAPGPAPSSAGGPAQPVCGAAPETAPVAAAAASVPAAGVTPPPAEAVAAAPVRRTAEVLYRGVYSSGAGAASQLAFVSARETPGEAVHAGVLGEGETLAGLTVKRITARELVVAGPTGEETAIGIGCQARVFLE